MIVEVWAETQGVAERRQIGWVSIIANVRGERRHMCRALRLGPWIGRDPETRVWDEHKIFAGGANQVLKVNR